MTVLNRILGSFLSLFTSRNNRSSTKQDKLLNELSESPNSLEHEQAFLANIAHLSDEEQQKRIERRVGLIRMAQQQGISDADRGPVPYRRTGDQ